MEDPLRLLPEDILSAIEDRLPDAVSRALDVPQAADLGPLVRQYVAQGGKRMRPQVLVWTWLHAGGAPPPPPQVLDAACAWELFHAFVLVHDDIIDAAATRRGAPALHHALAGLDGSTPTLGTHMAIVAGDLLFTCAFDLLHALDLDLECYRRLLRLFTRVARQTGIGQAIDILASQRPLDELDERTLLEEYLLKTAAYTFEGPMLSGAILAHAPEAACAAISRFGLAVGQAYQLANDLADLARPCAPGCDLLLAKRTLTLVRHRGALGHTARRRFDDDLDAIVAGNGSALDRAETLRRELLVSPAMESTRATIGRLASDATAACEEPALPPRLAAAMRLMAKDLANAGAAKDARLAPA